MAVSALDGLRPKFQLFPIENVARGERAIMGGIRLKQEPRAERRHSNPLSVPIVSMKDADIVCR